MKTWTAHLHATKPPVLLKEGFAWGGYMFGPLWLLAQGAWIPGLLALAVYAVLAVVVAKPLIVIVIVVANWCLGLFGHDVRHWALRLRGYTLAHVVAARDADGAFLRLLGARPDLTDRYMPVAKT